MENLVRLLKEHPFLQGLAEQHLQTLVPCAANVRFEAGQWVLREGEEARQFYLLRSGQVAIEVYVPGRGSVCIQTLGEGDVLGWSWLVTPYRWHFDARALQLTRAISLDAGCLRARSEEDHELGYELLRRFVPVILQRLQAARLQLLDIYRANG